MRNNLNARSITRNIRSGIAYELRDLFIVVVVITLSAPAGKVEAQEAEKDMKQLRELTRVTLTLHDISIRSSVKLIFQMKNFELKLIGEDDQVKNRLKANVSTDANKGNLANLLSLLLKISGVHGTYENRTFALRSAKSQMKAGLWVDQNTRYEPSEKMKKNVEKKLNQKIKLEQPTRSLFDHVKAIMDKIQLNSFVVGPKLIGKQDIRSKKVTMETENKTGREYLDALTQSREITWKIACGVLFLETPDGMHSVFMTIPPEKQNRIKEMIDAFFKDQSTDVEKKIKSLKLESSEERFLTFFETASTLFDLAGENKKKKLITTYSNNRSLIRNLSNLVYDEPLKLPRKLTVAFREQIDLSSHFEPLIQQLGDKSYRKRKQATDKLSKAGCLAEKELKKHADSDNPEVKKRIRELLKILKDR